MSDAVSKPLRLPGDVTMGTVAALVDPLNEAAARATGALHVDASALTELDTAAVALLLHARRAAQARSLALQVSGAPAKLRELARLYGVLELLPLDEAEVAAST